MEFDDQHQIETYKSLITIAIECFKYLALINGGAVISLLTYLGNLAGKGLPRPDARAALSCFIGGLVCCGLTLFVSYLTQLRLFNEYGQAASTLRSHRLPLYLTMLFSIGSLSAFCVGAWLAVRAFA